MTESPHTISEHPTAFSSLAVREAAYARLRHEIGAAKEVILSCHRRHNELSLISRLPPELLARIFEHLRAQYVVTDIRWIRGVSNVCSRWRHVALESPSLWSGIPFNYPDWAREMLARSKKAALNVVVGRQGTYGFDSYYTLDSPSRLASIVKAAIQELSHIKNLQLSQGKLTNVDYEEIIKHLEAPAPFLETVEITAADLPVNLFAGVSPNLTGLELTGCSIDMRSPIVANLRTLKLSHAPTSHRKIPIDQFISALSTMPRLETLHVIDSLRRGSAVDPPADQVAELPQLTELSIDTALSNYLFLLDHIVYPTSTRVSAKYQNDSAGIDSDISVVRSFAEKLCPRVLGPILSVKLHKRTIKVWRSPHTSSKSGPASPADLEISLPVLSEFEPAAQCFIHSLALTHLETLIFDWTFSQELFETCFGELVHLTTVYAIGAQPITFLWALTGAGAGAGPTKLNFSALETLGIEGWDFEDRPVLQAGNTLFEVLRSCLIKRREAGAPLPKLTIDACLHVDEDVHVDVLRAAVGEVDWDGETNFTEEEESDDYGDEYFDGTDYDEESVYEGVEVYSWNNM